MSTPQIFKNSVLIISVLILIGCTSIRFQDAGDPLFLSPLIKAGEISQARESAKVPDFHPISYSGFITVNEETNSNIFFWYFPAEEAYDEKTFEENDVPVILWNDGGPGISAFFSIFSQNGPFSGNAAGDNFTLNPFSWHKKYHMIYMDNPVEVGFSFTEKEEGFVSTPGEAARDSYEFLTQFFILFPQLQQNQFFTSGGSYGATYAIETAHLIHQKNSDNPTVHINLTGIILDSPWIEAYSQVDYGDFLFNSGLINEKSREHFKTKEKEIRDFIDQEKYLEGFKNWAQLTQKEVFTITGYPALNNIYNDNLSFVNMTNFAIRNSTRKAIHVGIQKFELVSIEQQGRMHAAMMRSEKPNLDELLILGYRVLIYTGNMDGTTGHIGIQKIVKTLTWESANDLIDGPRSIWKDESGVAGFVTNAGDTSSFVVVRNAGHGCLIDQPQRVFHMVNKFVMNEDIM